MDSSSYARGSQSASELPPAPPRMYLDEGSRSLHLVLFGGVVAGVAGVRSCWLR